MTLFDSYKHITSTLRLISYAAALALLSPIWSASAQEVPADDIPLLISEKAGEPATTDTPAKTKNPMGASLKDNAQEITNETFHNLFLGGRKDKDGNPIPLKTIAPDTFNASDEVRAELQKKLAAEKAAKEAQKAPPALSAEVMVTHGGEDTDKTDSDKGATEADAAPATEAEAKPEYVFDGTDQEMEMVIRNFCDYLGVDYIIQSGIAKMKVTFRCHNIGDLSESPEECRKQVEDLFDSMLAALGMQRRLVGNVYHIEKRGQNYLSDEPKDGTPSSHLGMTLQIVRMKYIQPNLALSGIQQLAQNSSGRFIPVPNMPLLILADSANNMARYLEILELLDQDPYVRRAFILKHANAQEVTNELKILFSSRQTATGRPVDFVALPRLNIVNVLNLTPEFASEVEEWMERLDKSSDLTFDSNAQDAASVIDGFCKHLGYSYVLDKSVGKQAITFHAYDIENMEGTAEEKREAIKQLFESMLIAAGLQMRQNGNIYHIERTGEFLLGEGTEGVRVQVITLRHLQANQAISLLKPLTKSSQGVALAVPNNPYLVLADTPTHIKRYMEVIDMLDVDPTIRKAYTLAMANSDDVAKELKSIFAKNVRPNGQPIDFYSITRLNMVVASNLDKEEIILMDRWVSLLDSQSTQADTTLETRIYRMQTESAEDIAQTLQSIFKEVKTKQQQLDNEKKQKGIPVTNISDDVPSIVANASTNTLLINTSLANHRIIQDLLKELDKEKKQVLIEVLIAEVTLTESTSLGIEWSLFQDAKGGNVIQGAQSKALGQITSTTTPSEINTLQAAADLAKSGTPGFNYFLSETNKLMAMLHASHVENRLDVLSSPNILTADGSEAEISIGEEVPVPKTTTSDGLTTTGYDYQEAKIKLTVKPFINEQGEVTLDINQIIKQVQTGSTAGSAPSFLSRELKTKLSVDDGQTVVIGGLIQKNNDTSTTAVPGISRIPFFGWLGKSKSDTVKGTELLIVMTPRVVRTRDEVDRAVNSLRDNIIDSLKRDDLGKKAGLTVPKKPWWVRISTEDHPKRKSYDDAKDNGKNNANGTE